MNIEERAKQLKLRIADDHRRAIEEFNLQTELIFLKFGIDIGSDINKIKMDARRIWWRHCEQIKVGSIPTFRNLWNDEETYKMII